MMPENIIMAAVEEIKLFDCALISAQKPESYLDKVLREIYNRLKNRSEAMTLLDEYLDKIRLEEYMVEALLIKPVSALYESLYHQLLDHQFYSHAGLLPYVYGGRQATRLVILSYCAE